MFLDDDLDRKTGKPKPRDLTNMSISELEDYKHDLLAEIQRVEEDVAKKSSHKDSIDSLFKPREHE